MDPNRKPDANTSHFDGHRHQYVYTHFHSHQHTHGICLGYFYHTSHMDPIADVNRLTDPLDRAILDSEHYPDAFLYSGCSFLYTFQYIHTVCYTLSLT